MTSDLNKAFEKNNLNRCWVWLNTNSDNNYKYYFRSLYKAFSLALDENIDRLYRDIKYHRYKPDLSIKLYIPKNSGVLRPISLLNLEDQIVYQSLISIVAEKLYKKAKKNYNKTVFGHLYAGKDSYFFYRKWSDGYVAFNHSITKAFNSGHKWTASFDLTAFYDSIDHKVLTHFLSSIGLTKEFARQLTDYLEIWTATTPNRIYHGHGIPQGPLPSGLLSEVILQHFDNHKIVKKSKVKYFRYVDDIRLFGKTEDDVRSALIELDYCSKEIGLFPQSSKINIHEVKKIEDEIKTISLPPEPINYKLVFDQIDVINRLKELSKRNIISNETRFKYVLAHADPNAYLAKRLLTILDKNPHLYQSIHKHLLKYQSLSKTVSIKLLELLKKNQLYEEVTASYLIASLNKIHIQLKPDFKDYCLKLHRKRKKINSPNLRSIVFVWLLNENYFKFSTIEKIYLRNEWWIIHNSFDFIDIDLFGKPSYEHLLNSLLKSESFEISIKAAYLIIKHDLNIIIPIKDINDSAQIILKKARIIRKTFVRKSYISHKLKELTDIDFPDKDWIKFLGTHHHNCERICSLIVSYFNNDANAFINELDVLNDFLCNALFLTDGTIGNYTLGRIGSALGPTTRFANKYPKFFLLVHDTHQLRLESDLSHPKIRSSGKPTRRIKFKELQSVRKKIGEGIIEIITVV